jgi:hypothetical protein
MRRFQPRRVYVSRPSGDRGNGMDERLIRATDAIVRTTTIDVRVLRLGAKQMTMGVFRQLIEECPIDWATLELKGLIWGSVNYFWGDYQGGYREDGTPIAVHVVWQKGHELRRAYIHSSGPDRFPRAHGPDQYGWRPSRYRDETYKVAQEMWRELIEIAHTEGQLFIAV